MHISKINSTTNTFFKNKYNNGENNATQPRYNVSHKFGAFHSGRADYNAESGDYDVRVKGFLPITKRRELYYPAKETEVIIRRTPEGIEKTTKTPTATITQMFDKSAVLKQDKDFSILDKGMLDIQNGEFSRLTETSLGSKYLLRYDKSLKRKIYIEEKPEGRIVRITDIKTGKPITSGDLIYDTYRNEDDERIVVNLLTGKVVERTKRRYKSDKIQYQILYYENSDEPKYVYNYNDTTGESTERYINKNGNVTRFEINHPSDKSKEIYTYDDDGNIISHIEETYGFGFGKIKPVVSKIIYNPNNSDIKKLIKTRVGSTTIITYSSSEKSGENTPCTIEYLKDNKLCTFEKLQNHGEYVSSRMEFNRLNEISYKSFDVKGCIKSVNYFDNKGIITTSLDFNPNSGKLTSYTKYNPDNKGYTQYIYSNYSKYPINIVKVDENNQIKKLTLDLDNKNAPKNLSSSYYESGSFDYDWENKPFVEGRKYPQLPKNISEALSLADSLENKSENAFKIRQGNFRRIG